MSTQFLTSVYRLHKPSAWKVGIMAHALLEYKKGFKFLLAHAEDRLEEIKAGSAIEKKNKKTGQTRIEYNAKSVQTQLPKVSALVNVNLASHLKESLIIDIAGSLASYFALVEMGENTGYPSLPEEDFDGLEDPLEAIRVNARSLRTEDEIKRSLLYVSKRKHQPVYFCRARDYHILYDPDKDTFFAYLKILPAKHGLGHKTELTGNLIDLATKKPLKMTSRSGFLVPLELGQRKGDWGWQYKNFLERCLDGTANIKIARLVFDGQHYSLHICFAVDCPDPYKHKAVMGIDRGVFFSAAYGIVDLDGQIITMHHDNDGFRHESVMTRKKVSERQKRGRRVTVKDHRGKRLDQILHTLCNDLVSVAKEHKAMIALEQLDIQIRGKFYRSAWAKIHQFLQYKTALEGVPLYGPGVWSAYTSKICIVCGCLNRDRKPDGGDFTCPTCNAVYHSDEGAGVNIARRTMYRKADWEEGGYMAFHASFASLMALPAIDLAGAGLLGGD